jgi:hypothetical protein
VVKAGPVAEGRAAPCTSPYELELRAALAEAHLTNQEKRARLLDTERIVTRLRFEATLREETIAALGYSNFHLEQQAQALQAEIADLRGQVAHWHALCGQQDAQKQHWHNAYVDAISSRWWRLGNKLRRIKSRLLRRAA